MKIYKFPYSKEHTRNDTDKFISDSIKEYMLEEGLALSGEIFIKRTSLGKPFAEGCGQIFVSVTHSNEILLVAVSECEIGIDCESKTRHTRDINSLAGRFFTPAERELLSSVKESEKEECFLEIWTKKEALVKLSGEGLSAITKTDSVNPEPEITLRLIDDYPEYIVSVAERSV